MPGRIMTATFEVEGRLTDGSTIMPTVTTMVSVVLTTNGVVVELGEGFGRIGSPPLTPRGWSQLASHAEALVKQANAAWQQMGSA